MRRTSRLFPSATLMLASLLISCGSAPAAAPSSQAATASSAAPSSAAASSSSASASPASAAGVSSSVAKPLVKVTIAQPSNSLGFSPVLIAQQKGFFHDEGIQANIVLAGSGSKTAAAVIGGSAQIGSSALGDVLGAVEQGQDILTFAGTVVGVDGALVVRRSVADKIGITQNTPLDQRVKALKGLKLAISTPGSGTDTELRYVLGANGLKPEQDVQILTTGSVVNSEAAYAKGAADGASLSSPNAQQALLNNDGVAAVDYTEVPAFKSQLSIGLWATSKWLDANSDTAARVTAAVWKALDYIHSNPKDAGNVVHSAAWSKLDPKVFDAAWSSEVKLVPATPDVRPGGLKALIDYVATSTNKKVNVTPNQLGTEKIVTIAKGMQH